MPLRNESHNWLEDLHKEINDSTYKSLSGYLERNPQSKLQEEGLPVVGNGYIGNLVGGIGSSFLRNTGDLAQFVGADNVGNTLNEGSKWIEERLPEAKQAEATWDFVTSPEGLTRGTGNALGSVASILLPSFLMPGGWIGTGAKAFSKIPGVTEKMGEWAVRGALGGIPESGMEAGSFERDALKNGMSPEEAREKSWDIFNSNLPFLMASNAVQTGLFPKVLGEGTNLVSRALLGTGNLLSQGGEEWFQQGIQNKVREVPYTYNPLEMFNPEYQEQLQAAKEGIAGFALPTAIGVGIGAYRNKNQKVKENSQPAETIQDVYYDTKDQNNFDSYKPNDGDLVNWAKNISGGANENTIKKVIAEAERQGVNPKLVLALANAESNIGLNAEKSSAGAIGVMQLMPETAEGLGVNPDNEDENIKGGIKYLKQMLDQFGDEKLATAAYNAGPGAVEQYGGIPPYGETQAYVSRIFGFLEGSPKYSAESKNSQPENIYTGEDGKSEGKYWVRQGDTVSFEGAQPQLLNAVDMLAKYYYENTGKRLVITAGTNGNHADGEHSHGAGWKVDVVDYGGGEVGADEDGPLTTKDFHKGKFADDFIAYGRSLGLGMNWEGDGSNNVHIDVALDGNQWDGNGENAGGFNIEKLNAIPKISSEIQDNSLKSSTLPTSTNETEENNNNESEIETKPIDFSDIDEETENLLNEFVFGKKENAEGEEKTFLNNITDENNQFVLNEENLNALAEKYRDELEQQYWWENLNKEKPAQLKQPTKPVKIENTTIPIERKNLENLNRRQLIDEVRKIRDFASETHNLNLLGKSTEIEQSGDLQQIKNFVNNNPLPEDFVAKYNKNNSDGTAENPTESKALAVNRKPKKELPQKVWDYAREPIDERNSEKRKLQGEAMLKIADAYKIKIENSALKGAAKKGYVKALNSIKQTLQSEGLLQNESQQDEYLNLIREYNQKQKELDASYRETQKIVQSGDKLSARKARKDFLKLWDEQKERQQKMLETGNKTRIGKPEVPPPYRKRLQDYENELAELKDSLKSVQKIGRNAQKLGDKTAEKQAKSEFDQLQKQIKAKNAEIAKFRETPEYQNDLIDELQWADEKRGKEIQSELESLQKGNSQKSFNFKEKLQEKFSQPVENENLEEEISDKPQENSQKINGNAIKVTTDKNKEISARYRIMDIDDVISSDNKNYEKELQPRDRNRDALRLQVEQMAQNLRPEDLMDSRNLNQGAPVIRSDGTVLNGNGRTMGIRKAYQIGKADAYKQALLERAEEFGLNKEDISKMKNPVLVREIENDLKSDLTEDITTSETGGARMGAQEQAQIDAKRIKEGTFNYYEDNEGADLTSSGNREFVGNVLADISNKNDINAYLDKEGNVSADGIARVKRAVFAAAFDDENLISRMAESADDNIRNVTNALLRAAPEIAKTRIGMEKGTNYKYDLSPITDAVRKLASLRNENKGVGFYLNEQKMFDEDKPEMREILSFLDKNKRSPKKMAEFLRGIAEGINNQGNPKQQNLFGETKPANFEEIVKRARQKVEESGEIDLNFSDNSNDENKKAEEIKESLAELAEKSWNDKDYNGKVSFTPSQKFRDKAQELFGHDVNEVFITSADIRHIKNKHSEGEDRRGQIDIKPENISEIYDVVNNFDSATKERDDKQGNQNIMVVKSKDGKNYALLVERGKSKAQVKTFYKQKETSQVSDAKSPNLNVQDDPVKVSADNITQTADDDKKQFNLKGKVDSTVITADMLVDDLTSQQKKFIEIGKEMGLPVKFFRATQNFGGVLRNGTSYVNENTHDYKKTFYYEMAHYLAYFNPTAFNEILDAGNITEKQRNEIRKRDSRYEKLSERELNEEVLADNFMNFAKRADLLKNIAKQDKNLAEKFISWLKSLMDKFTSFFSNPQGGLTRSQRNAMYSAFKKNIDSMVDKNGNKIFRMSRETFEIQKANGEKLPQMDLQMFDENSVDNKNKKVDNKKNHLTDEHKDRLFDFIKRHIENHIQEQLKKGIRESEIIKELNSENSRHRAKVLGAFKTTLRDWENHANDDEYRRLTVERVDKLKGLTDSEIDNEYKRIIANMKEVVDYGGLLYREIAIDRQTGDGQRAELRSWRDAERQRDEREGIRFKEGNGINQSHSEKQGDFFIDRFSINPSNNSNESWTARAKNWIKEKWNDGKSYSERRHKAITQKLQKLSGYKIHYRYFSDDKTPAMIDKIHKVITVKDAYQWQDLLPKVGEAVAEEFKLPATEKMNNYIADWLLTGADQNNSEESRAFQKAMRENPAKFELLHEIQKDFQDLANLDPIESYKASMGGNPTEKSHQSKFEKMYEEVVDDLDPLKKMVEEMEKRLGTKIADIINPYLQARMFKGTGGIVQLLIKAKTNEEVKNAIESLKKIYPNVDWSKFKPLQKIIADIGGEKNIADFEAYCIACLDKEMYIKNRSIADEKNKFIPVNNESKADAVISKYKDKFRQAQKDLVNFSNTVLEIQRDAGLLSEKQYQNIVNRWENYIPTQRIFDEAEEIGYIDALKHKRGSHRDIVHPIRVIIRNTALAINKAEKNKVKVKLANLARCGAYGDLISEVEFKNGNEPTITFKENGKKKYLATTPEIKRAIDNLDGDGTQANYIFKLLQAVSSFVSNTYTALSADFTAGNIFRDTQEAYIYQNAESQSLTGVLQKHLKNNPIVNLYRVLKMLPHILNKSELYYEWKAMGGSQSAFVSADMDNVEILIDDIAKSTKQKWKSSPFTQLLTSLQKFSEFSEEMTRLAIYKANKDMYAKNRNDGKATFEDMRRSAFESRNATIDFARGGSSLRKINKYWRFSNVAVQDLDKSIEVFKGLDPRNLKTHSGRLKFADTTLKIMFGSMLPTVILFAMNHDKDWYKYGTQQWQKDTSWILDEGVKIPKSLSFAGKLVSTLTEGFLKRTVDNEPVKSKRIFQPFSELLPSLMPTLLQPIVEAYSDYSFFYGGAIVPAKERRLAPYQQYGDKTSEIAKAIGASDFANFLSKAIFDKEGGISPRKIDHVLNGYFGFLNTMLSGITNLMVEDRREKMTFDLTEFPMTKRFIFDPYKNPQIVVDYYNKCSEQEVLYNSYQNNKKSGKKEIPEGLDLKLYKKIQANEKAMKNISTRERKLIENTKISAEERKKQLREYEKKRIEIAKRALEK